jgi:hypothetical protein
MPHRRLVALALPVALLAGCSGAGAGPDPVAAEPAGYLGPELALVAPRRAAQLAVAGEGPAPVSLQGTACDAVHPLTSLQVAGRSLPLGPDTGCQPFQAEVRSRLGLNVVEGDLVNAAGEHGRLAQAFLRAPSYFETAPGAAAALASTGLLLRLGPDLVDDGDRSTPNDLATIAERALSGLDLDAAVGTSRVASPDSNGDGAIDEVTHDCVLWKQRNKATGFEAWKDGALSAAGLTVDRLALVDGGLSARLTLHGLRVPVAVMGNLDSACLGAAQKTVRGLVRAGALTLEGRVSLGLDAGGQPRVAFTEVATTLSGVDIDVALGALVDWTGLGSLIGDAIEAQVRGPVQDALRGAVADRFQAWLAEAVDRLAAFQLPLDLPAELGGTRLLVETRLDLVDVTPARALVGTALQVRAEAPLPAHAGARGAMRLGGGPPDLAALEGSALGLGLHLDAVNQLLHAAWQAGAFDLDDVSRLVALSGPAGLKVSLFSNLPPVVVPRPDGAPGLELGWGEVAFELRLAGATPGATATARGFLSLRLAVERLELDAGGQTFTPVLAGGPEVSVEVTQVDWDHRPTTRELAGRLLATLVANALPEALGRAVRAVPLPVLDLAGLDPTLPALRLGLVEPRTALLGHYQTVAAGLTALP